MGVYDGEPSGPQCITHTDQLENFIELLNSTISRDL